jgi:hypothetical protein
MLHQTSSVIAFGLLLLTLSGCAMEGGVYDRSGPQQNIHIPPGHMPPPGECRIWYPDRPPGQQPPSGHCSELRDQVPPGAILVRG